MKLTKNLIWLLTILITNFFLALPTKAQVAIGENKDPESFSILELITSAKKGGLRLPQLTTDERDTYVTPLLISDPDGADEGLVIYNTTENCLEFWNGERWISLCDGSSCGDEVTAGTPSASNVCRSSPMTPITIITTGATKIGTPTGLPAGLSALFEDNIITISGIPTTSGSFNYTIPLTGSCGTIDVKGSITVGVVFNPPNPASSTICTGTAHDFGMATVTNATGYLWEESPDGTSNWVPATGTNDQFNYTTPILESGVMYYRRTVTSACGSVTSPAASVTIAPALEFPLFYGFNLGADPDYDTPLAQMTRLAAITSSPTQTEIFGDWYQWGRVADGHEKRNPRSETTDQSGLSASDYNDPGNGQVANGSSAYGRFITTSTTPDDWRGAGNQRNNLWGNGVAINTPTGVLSDGPIAGHPGIGDNSGNRYQGTTWVTPESNPCPTGYRVPTQDEWEALGNYCDPSNAGSNVSGLTGFFVTNTGYTWVATRCGPAVSNTCIATNQSWNPSSPGGYTIYRTAEWIASGYTTNSDLLAPDAPKPLLFLPATGYRHQGDAVLNVGTGGYYWSSSISGTRVFHLSFGGTNVSANSNTVRAIGFSVRCVAELD